MFAKVFVAAAALLVTLSLGELSANWKHQPEKFFGNRNEKRETFEETSDLNNYDDGESEEYEGLRDDPTATIHSADALHSSANIMEPPPPHQGRHDQSSNSPWRTSSSSSSEKFSPRIRRSVPPSPSAAHRPSLRTRRQASAEMDRRILALRDLLLLGGGDPAGSSYPHGGAVVVKKRVPGPYQSAGGSPPMRSRVAAGMRYAGIGKRKANSRSKVDAGMRYMGIGKRHEY